MSSFACDLQNRGMQKNWRSPSEQKKRMTETAAFEEKSIGIEFAYHGIWKNVVKNSKTYICYKKNWKQIICLNERQQNEISLTFKKEKSVLGEHGNVIKR